MTRPFDVVVFGATGFTGGLVANYLSTRGPEGLRWALAGRSREKLEAVARGLPGMKPTEIVIADVARPETVREVARSTKVLLTTVGPYVEHGEPALAACVAEGTHYVDITGEPEFVDASIERHHAEAKSKGIYVVHCCGFDSIPHDLGAQFTAELLPSDGPIAIEGYVRSRGTFSGGTWHSALGAMSRLRGGASQGRPRSKEGKRVKLTSRRVKWVKELDAWGCPLPTIDGSIVLRSAKELPEFGTESSYGHYARVRHLSTVVGGIAAIGGIAALAQVGPTLELLKKVRAQGDGPSEAQRKRSWFEVSFLGTGSGKTVETSVSGGDPGYDETAKMIAESALCLAFDGAKLGGRFGVVTPAVAMGKTLRERLVKAGIRFQIKRQG